MISIQQITKECSKLKGCIVTQETGKTVRVDIPENNAQMRNDITSKVLALFKDSYTSPARPHDVKIPPGFTVLVKPAKGAKKSASGAFYGILSDIDLKRYDTQSFSDVCKTFASGKIVQAIKEASDVKAVSDLNKKIYDACKGTTDGITLSILNYTFKNVVGAVPVTNGEPKADIVLVCRDGNTLYPDGYISYKMGTNAKGFQQYSGVTEKTSRNIFYHKETIEFFDRVYAMIASGAREDIFQPIKDKELIAYSTWGEDYGDSRYGINNCHFLAQGEVSIIGKRLNYTHLQKRGDFNFDKTYEPVFGCRAASGRVTVGPNNIRLVNTRVGIYPRAFRSSWLK